MGDGLSISQAAIDANLAKSNYTGNVQEYSVKKKENLWKIAKKNLKSSNKKVSQTEIQRRVYDIAKLNNLDTAAKMNKLKVGQNLFVPTNAQQLQQQQATKAIAKKQAQTKTQTNSTSQEIPQYLKAPKPEQTNIKTPWSQNITNSSNGLKTPWAQYAKPKKETVKPAQKQPTVAKTNKNIAKPQVQQTPQKPQKQAITAQQYKTSAEKSTGDLINTLQKDKTVKIEKGLNTFGEIYHVTNETTYGPHNYIDKNHMVTSFEVNNGEINKIYLEDKNNINPDGYDYTIDKKGTIKLQEFPNTTKGQLTKEQNSLLRNSLGGLLKKVK